MQRRPALALLFALMFVALSCGRESDSNSVRIIATPDPSGTAAPAKTKKPKASPTPSSTVKTTSAPAAPSTATATSSGSTKKADLASARVKLTRVASLDQPLAMAMRKGDAAFYIAEKGGRIRRVSGGTVGSVVLDISSEVSTSGEQGLLGLAFSPDGKRLYVNFTNGPGDTIVREYDWVNGKATSPRDVIEIDQPYANHNGGNILFGPDGFLYIGMGDGGSGGDPQNNAQNINSLLGKMLRINPTGSGTGDYSSPGSNPFVGRSGADEVWAYGLRNPWRFSFDRSTKALWIADVGQNAWEEINVASGGSDGGENYGWRRMEGTHSYGGGTPPSNHHGPIYEYSHDGGNLSVTGGFVYRGSRIPDLVGAYVFADFAVGRPRAFVVENGRATGHRFLGPQVDNVSSFGQDAKGELFVMSLDGGFYRIDPA